MLLDINLSNLLMYAWGYFGANESIPKNGGKNLSVTYSNSFTTIYGIFAGCADGGSAETASYTPSTLSYGTSSCTIRIGNWASTGRTLNRAWYFIIGKKN